MVVFCLRGKSPDVMRRILNTSVSDIKVPMQVKAELLLGAVKSAKPAANSEAVLNFLSPFQTVWPDDAVVEKYVTIRAGLERAGMSIGEADLWITATAVAVGGSVATNNTAEFSKVPDLKIEDWSIPGMRVAALENAIQEPLRADAFQYTAVDVGEVENELAFRWMRVLLFHRSRN